MPSLWQAATSVSANDSQRGSVFLCVCHFSCVLWKFFGFLLDLVDHLFNIFISQNRLFESVTARGQHQMNIIFFSLLQSQWATTLLSAQEVKSINVCRVNLAL